MKLTQHVDVMDVYAKLKDGGHYHREREIHMGGGDTCTHAPRVWAIG